MRLTTSPGRRRDLQETVGLSALVSEQQGAGRARSHLGQRQKRDSQVVIVDEPPVIRGKGVADLSTTVGLDNLRDQALLRAREISAKSEASGSEKDERPTGSVAGTP